MSNTKGTSVETPTEADKTHLAEVPKQGKTVEDDCSNLDLLEGDIVDERTASEKIKDALRNKKFLASLVGVVAGGSLLYIVRQRNAAETETDVTSV
jgi:hypothetical protein